jgi:hypothetical protein
MGRALVTHGDLSGSGRRKYCAKQEKQLTNPALCKWENVKKLSSMFSKSLDF